MIRVCNVLKNWAKYLFCSVFILSLSSCQKEEGENNRMPVRTVIVYMVADNNLDYFCLNDINEMEKGWQQDTDGNLIVYLDRAESAGVAHPIVYKINHDTTVDISSSIIKVYKEHNSIDEKNMYNILLDIISSYPAQSYGLILWSHGTAWLPAGTIMSDKPNNPVMRSFGKDVTDEMNIFDLKNAFPCHFDFIIFDACYMGAIEVAYELRNQTDFILSSATETLSSGYPYHHITKHLFDQTMNYSKIADDFFQSYAILQGAMQSASISVVKTSELNILADKVRQIMNDTIHLQYVDTHLIQQFSTRENGTLFDFDNFMSRVSTNEAYYLEFNRALSQSIFYKACTSSILETLKINTFSGMSIFIPDTSNTQYYDFYKNFDWYKDSSYDNYFNKFVLND
jgi:hypothetical protein